jgi:D-sedoheptulose 7-phosphate isomerase
MGNGTDGWNEYASAHLRESIEVKNRVIERCLPSLFDASRALAVAFKNGGKLLVCGNGGSAADSQHIATEFVVRLSSDFERPALPAIALTTDSSILTAAGNDYAFERIFARQVEALGRTGDVLLAISTSGNSKVVVEAVTAAKMRGLLTIGLLGSSGGAIGALTDHAIIVPSDKTQHIQESHIALYHIMVALVEREVFSE